MVEFGSEAANASDPVGSAGNWWKADVDNVFVNSD